MRPLGVLALLTLVASAGDAVHLANGRTIHGEVLSESAREVVVRTGSGHVVVPRARVRSIERRATPRPVDRLVTRRDEWSLVLHRGATAGWRHVVHTEGPNRIVVEDRTVFFRHGGGDDVDIRRVQVAGRDGRPLEFLLMETYGHEMEIVSGDRGRGRWVVRTMRGGTSETRELELGDGWVLPLTAWSCFLREARPGETRQVRALDVRRLELKEVVLRREPDEAAPGTAQPWRAISLAGDFHPSRALFRPGDGALRVELNGATLVAVRATRDRVELARRAHAPPEPLTVEQAEQLPFVERAPDPVVRHARAGLSLASPDTGWRATSEDRDRGLVLTFEKLALFASLEVFVFPWEPREKPAQERCFRAALARLRLTAERVEPLAGVERFACDGGIGLGRVVAARHRGEDLRCLLVAIPARGRSIVLVGAAPERWWRWAERDFRAFVASLRVVP